ncbi:MAG TPA: DUF3237 domain-containing protein [Solirubrobacteraceae bacterium]|jgi:hypothetical protein|nr:DUF3237 domain-containing protein [Solirubrobacteraceae bacterium]
MELVHEFTLNARLKPPVAIGGPYGQRIFFEVIDGEVSGERLNGKLFGGGGDWILAGADGFGRLDVRIQAETSDGAFLYISYGGLLEMNDAVQQALAAGAGTDFADQYFRSTPHIETGDPRYAWATQSVFVGEGRVLPGAAVEYRIARVA